MKIASIAEVSKEQMKVLYTQTQLQFSATFLFLGGGKCLTFISHGTILNLTLAVRDKQETSCVQPLHLSNALIRRWWARKLVGSIALMTLLNGVGRDYFEPSSI